MVPENHFFDKFRFGISKNLNIFFSQCPILIKQNFNHIRLTFPKQIYAHLYHWLFGHWVMLYI
jgi:hypothetical protein